MALRYWVSAIDATWDATAGTKWALTSGGAGGQSVPTSADDAIFDANSGFSMTLSNSSVCNNFTCAGFTRWVTLPNNVTFNIHGNLSMDGNVNFSIWNTMTSIIRMKATTTGHTVSLGTWVSLPMIYFEGVGGSWQLLSNLNTNAGSTVTLSNGTLDLNGYNIDTGYFNLSGSATRVFTGGAGIVKVRGTGTVWDATTITNLTFTPNTFTIQILDISAQNKTIEGGGLTYYNCYIASGGTGDIIIKGSNTFNVFTIIAPNSVKFENGKTSTFQGDFVTTGDATHIITIGSTTTATHTLLKSSGIIIGSYLNLSYSIALGGATWYAANSIDSGNNSGWIFSTPSVISAVSPLIMLSD
jgi:hypothetical protein